MALADTYYVVEHLRHSIEQVAVRRTDRVVDHSFQLGMHLQDSLRNRPGYSRKHPRPGIHPDHHGNHPLYRHPRNIELGDPGLLHGRGRNIGRQDTALGRYNNAPAQILAL